MKKALICLLLALMCITPALAEGITLEGTVVATGSTAVLAPAAGVVQDAQVLAGAHVSAGEEIAALMEMITYAEIDGIVRVCGEAGENAETVASRYGAVVYIQPEVRYTVAASTQNAYDSLDNRIIRLGEKMYVRSVNDATRTGSGTVTAINGSSFSVEVTSGNLAVSDSVYLYRSSGMEATARVGKGTATYAYPVAYTATGTLSRILVADGTRVTKGTPLFATVEAAAAYCNRICSPAEGTVASLSVTPGTLVEAGTLVATIYPDDALRLEILADEIDLRCIAVEQQVVLEFVNGTTAQGQVERISGIRYVPESTDEETDDTALFSVYVTFQADVPVSCGMTAKVTFNQ